VVKKNLDQLFTQLLSRIKDRLLNVLELASKRTRRLRRMIVLAVVVAGHQAALVASDRVAARGVHAAPVDGAAVARNTRPPLLVKQVAVQAQLKVVTLGRDKLHAGIRVQNGGL